jgi:hypothetical protein
VTAHGSSAVGRPWTETPGLLPASDSERGAALVTVGPGGPVSLVMSRWCYATCHGFYSPLATTSLTAGEWVTVPEACPGIPHPTLGFSVAVEVYRVRPGCLLSQSRQRKRALPCTAHAPALLHPGNAAYCHRPLLSPTLCDGPVSRSVRAFTGHVSPPAGEPFAIHLSVRTSPEPGDRDAP